ncbi:unnamed protein product [Owenia fusiformis]|uniref:Uncharacterized protein n=1 Tax=Owenia fusiformis TaxID=6347 RepID=A0A8J1U8U8_OWEFU|nr:unnamed protein product [Owenia fusiformis]
MIQFRQLNVLNYVRKAAQHLLGDQTERTDPPWANEENLYKKEIFKNASIFRDSFAAQEEREEAVKRIGHNGYTGGLEASNCASELIPDMLEILRSDDAQPSMKSAICQALSEILYRNRKIQDKMKRAELGGASVLLELVLKNDDERCARWAAYALTVLIDDNVPIMRELLVTPSLKPRLTLVLNALDWPMWPENYVKKLYALLGLNKKRQIQAGLMSQLRAIKKMNEEKETENQPSESEKTPKVSPFKLSPRLKNVSGGASEKSSATGSESSSTDGLANVEV